MSQTCHERDYTRQIPKEKSSQKKRRPRYRERPALLRFRNIPGVWGLAPRSFRHRKLHDASTHRAPCSEIGIDREAGAHLGDLAADLFLDRSISVLAIGGQTIGHLDDPVRDLAELGLAEAPRRARRCAKPNAGCDGRLFRIERHAVLVAGDMRT